MALTPRRERRHRYYDEADKMVYFHDRHLNRSFYNPGAGGVHSGEALTLGHAVTEPDTGPIWPSPALAAAAAAAGLSADPPVPPEGAADSAANAVVSTLWSSAFVRVLALVPGALFEDRNVGGIIEAVGASAAACASYLTTVLGPEMALYPVSLVRDFVGLRVIVLTGAMHYNGQSRSALPSYQHHALYLDVEACTLASEFRKTLHHEFFHMIDFADLGIDHFEDSVWQAVARTEPIPLAEAGVRGGEEMRDGMVGVWCMDRGDSAYLPGFTTAYGAASIIEDKAECFAALMYFRPESLADVDPLLAAKLDEIRRRMTASVPDWRWESVAAVRRADWAARGSRWRQHRTAAGKLFYTTETGLVTSWNPHS